LFESANSIASTSTRDFFILVIIIIIIMEIVTLSSFSLSVVCFFLLPVPEANRSYHRNKHTRRAANIVFFCGKMEQEKKYKNVREKKKNDSRLASIGTGR
jgi:hypothetical protein